MKSTTRFIQKMLLCMTFILALTWGTTAAADTAAHTQTKVYWAEQIAGKNRVLYPVVSGMTDQMIQNQLNQTMFAALGADEMLVRLDRIRQRPESEQQTRSLYMTGEATVAGQTLSIMVRTQGEQQDGSIGDSAQCFNFDLTTGERLTLDAIFSDPASAKARMTQLVQAQVLPELSAYLQNGEVLPLPEDSFFLSERGIVFYYPASRFSMISGSVGACAFDYYEVEPWLSTDTARFGTLFAKAYSPSSAAADIAQAVESGKLPPLPFTVGTRMGEYLAAHALINDPDYTLTSMVYQFEEAALRGAGVETWVYDEAPEEERAVTAIRSTRVDFCGIQVGVSTLDDCRALLGEPRETLTYDDEQAMDMMLTPGESLFYAFGKNELEIHADEAGVVSCVMVRAGAQ